MPLGLERREGPPREGPALLQGLAICGVCGGRMNVAYHVRAFRPGRSVPHYFCQGRSGGDKRKQGIRPGAEDGRAENLNSRGFVPGYGKPFHGPMIARIAKDHGLKTRWERLRERGMLTLEETSNRLGICTDQVKAWRAAGLLRGHLCNDKNEYPYEDPGPNPPRVGREAKLPMKDPTNENVSHRASEVQCEA